MRFRHVLTLALLVTAGTGTARTANAQYAYPGGYGGYGWGGWGMGGTVGGDYARGMGVYAAGAGIYNQQTAVANSIDTDTVMRFNEYVYESQQVTNRKYFERQAILTQKRKDASDEIRKRIYENPDQRDVMNGDALNAILDQVTDPKVGSSALRSSKTMIPGEAIQQIPFTYASQGVTFSLAQLSTDENWPLALKDKVYAAERGEYLAAIEAARLKNDDGELASEDIVRVRSALRALRDKVEANPPTEKQSIPEVNTYMRGLAGFARMLEKPSIDRPIAELDKIKEVTIGDFMGFMHAYNLRFSPAVTPKQRAVYSQLFPLLAETRDKALGQKPSVVAKANADAPKGRAIDFFQGIPSQHLYDDVKKDEPKK